MWSYGGVIVEPPQNKKQSHKAKQESEASERRGGQSPKVPAMYGYCVWRVEGPLVKGKLVKGPFRGD